MKDKYAFVSGGSDGIGASVALLLSRQGWSVTITGRDSCKLNNVISKLDLDLNQKHNKITVDYNDPTNMINVVREHSSLNNINYDILINNSGGPKPGNIIDSSIDDFYTTFNRHLICNHLLFKEFYSHMKANKYGRVINIISTSVKQPIRGLGVSNTIRGAVASWAKTLSYEVAKNGVTVNNILPGFTKTGRLESIIKTKSSKLGISEDNVIKDMISSIPVGRFGKPEEIANLVTFLSSENSSYINGVSIQVDGGRLESI